MRAPDVSPLPTFVFFLLHSWAQHGTAQQFLLTCSPTYLLACLFASCSCSVIITPQKLTVTNNIKQKQTQKQTQKPKPRGVTLLTCHVVSRRIPSDTYRCNLRLIVFFNFLFARTPSYSFFFVLRSICLLLLLSITWILLFCLFHSFSHSFTHSLMLSFTAPMHSCHHVRQHVFLKKVRFAFS